MAKQHKTPKPASKPVASPAKNNAPKTPRNRRGLLIALLLVLLAAGGGGYYWWKKNQTPNPSTHQSEPTLTAKNPLLELIDPDDSGIDFQNLIVETPENNITKNINMYNGGGLAVADINNDNLPDIYFICSNGPNRLYLNQGNFKFKDITESAGLVSPEGFETAVTAADVNADGFLDFYVCRGGPNATDERRNKLFINNGNLTFTERGREYGIDDISASTGANFFDYDLDGDLDLYLLNYPSDINWASKFDVRPGVDGKPKANTEPKTPLDTDRLYRNDGGKFTDVSKEAGIWNFAFGLSVSVSDFNRDGYPDVYVGNDFIHPDILYINNKNGTFTNRLSEYFGHCTLSTMGTELADVDNDGLVDLFAVEMLPANNQRNKTLQTGINLSRYLSMVQGGYFEPVIHNVLQHNNGNGTFSDLACLAGVFKTDWSWSGLMVDFDNDGLKDLHVTNGYRREITNRDFVDFALTTMLKPENLKKNSTEDIIEAVPTYKIRNFVFQNQGDWKYEDQGGDWMTMKAAWSCGAAWADFDADGDLDLIVNNLEEPAFLYRNRGREQNAGNYVQCELQGAPPNPFAVGASVLIEYAGNRQYQEMNPTRGIFSSVEHLVHFGLKEATQIDRLTVRWPDGKFQTLTNVPVNQRLTLRYADAAGYCATLTTGAAAGALFTDLGTASGLNFKHVENSYVDFESYPLMVWKESDLGPLVAKGDVNGDGLDDCYLGNAFGSPGGLFVQQPGGRFRLASAALWESEKAYEDHGAVFFDFEVDGDLDLFIVGGGYECVPEGRAQAWQGRLYLNTDGKGAFAKANPQILPDIRDVGMRVIAYDYDGDLDDALFIGGRVTPDKWPLPPRGRVLRNDRDHFTDVTNEVGGDFAQCGMVTDLAWADLDGDNRAELVVVGEWMPVTVFKLQNGRLSDATSEFGLGKTNGLWFRLAVADLDGDGDQDLVTGNMGRNTRFTASAEAPLRCFARDFDNNGALDPVVAFYENGKLYPLPQKDILLKQMPALKKKYLYANKYAEATMSDMWPQSELDAALNLYCYDLESCWWENQRGKLVRRPLPALAQASAIQGILAADFTGDGKVDLLLAGNKYGMDVESGRYDAGAGVLLAGDGRGGFTWVNNLESGFWAQREARDLALLRSEGGRAIIVVANNNGEAQVIRK